MLKISRFFLTATLTAFIVVALAGYFSPTSAQIFSKNSQNYLQFENQQPAAELQASESGTEAQELENGEGESEPQEQDLEQKERELDRELEIDQKNSPEPEVEEVPGPGEELGIDDNFPVQPPAEEIEIKL